MKYKRLTNTNIEEYNPELDFCAGCKYYGEPNGCNRPHGTCDNYDRFIETYQRLEELETKIENGDFIWRHDVLILKQENSVANKYSMEIKKIICEYLGVPTIDDLEKLSLLDSLLPYDVILDKLQELDEQYIKEKEE